GWPHSDANYILITEIVLMTLFLTMNATDRSLQLQGHEHYKNTGDFVISSMLVPLFQNMPASSLIIIERGAWWLHIIGILAFLNYCLTSLLK
ncbi:MAG TPA: Fe-S oxidoreductase, partial [Ferruginibacter sp.]|nr:Fe-S oxidoreductase [Ferruginibacter sp.]